MPREISVLKKLTRMAKAVDHRFEETALVLAPEYLAYHKIGNHFVLIMEDLGSDWVDLFTFVDFYHAGGEYSMPLDITVTLDQP